MTESPLAERVRALVDEMRASQSLVTNWRVITDHWRERLEAALAAGLAPKPPDDAFATRLAQRLHNEALRGPNDAELEIPEAVRIIQEELAAAALAPHPARTEE